MSWYSVTQKLVIWNMLVIYLSYCLPQLHYPIPSLFIEKETRLKPLSQWEVGSGDIELTRCNSTVKAICVGLASSANYPDQWSDATITRCKLHCERVELFVSLLGGAAYAAVSRDFQSVPHLRFYQRVYGCQSSVLSNSRVYISTFVYISSELFLFPDLRQRRAGQITHALVVPPRD